MTRYISGQLRSLALAVRLALRNLLQDRLRLVLSVIGVALSVMLILFVLGLREGTLRTAVIYLDNAPGSVAVMPPGAKSTSAGLGQFWLLRPPTPWHRHQVLGG